jgi:hypothetical protein
MLEHADGFEALTEATGDLIEIWAEDLNGELDQEDFKALGYDVEEIRILGLDNEP